MREKIKEREGLRIALERSKREGRRVVFTNGCFDLLHIGHLRYLEEAKTLGDLLVVAVNSDRSVRELKGPLRPIIPEEERAEMLSGLGCVDYVTIFDEKDPLNLITELRPHVLVKGGDWTKEKIVGREVVEGFGGEVVVIPFVQGFSTSHLIQRIINRYEKKS